MEPVRRRILQIYMGVLAVGMAYLLWLKCTGIGIPCMVNQVTGLLCPGCGVSRMFLALLRLDFSGAFRYNSVMFCLFCYWNPVALLCAWGKPKGIRSPRFLYGSLWCSVAALAMFCILRNCL